MTKINWTQVAVFVLVAMLIFGLGTAPLLGLFGGHYGGWGMMGRGMMGLGPFGGFGMMLMWLFPLGLLIAIVLGSVWLVRALAGTGTTAKLVAPACPQCHRSLQSDWQVCPYCGHRLTGSGQEE